MMVHKHLLLPTTKQFNIPPYIYIYKMYNDNIDVPLSSQDSDSSIKEQHVICVIVPIVLIVGWIFWSHHSTIIYEMIYHRKGKDMFSIELNRP